MSNVIDLKSRRKKNEEPDSPKLYVNRTTGKITGSPHFKTPEPPDEFGDRMQRIRASLEKINSLMRDLKEANRNRDDD